jgi:hypothetical protein
MNSLSMAFIKETYNWLYEKVKQDSPNNQVLEPFSTLLKLAIISYKSDGTKIAVLNNKLYIQEPGVSQGLVRYAWGNNREEIHFLLKPLMRCIDLYPISENEELKLIYKQSVEGLKKLKKSYNNSSSNVCFTIDLYISILEQTLQEKSVHVHSYEASQNLNDLTLSSNTKLNLERLFEGIWTANDISLVSSMFISVNTASLCKSDYLKSIENIIRAKEGIIQNKITRATQLV